MFWDRKIDSKIGMFASLLAQWLIWIDLLDPNKKPIWRYVLSPYSLPFHFLCVPIGLRIEGVPSRYCFPFKNNGEIIRILQTIGLGIFQSVLSLRFSTKVSKTRYYSEERVAFWLILVRHQGWTAVEQQLSPPYVGQFMRNTWDKGRLEWTETRFAKDVGFHCRTKGVYWWYTVNRWIAGACVLPSRLELFRWPFAPGQETSCPPAISVEKGHSTMLNLP